MSERTLERRFARSRAVDICDFKRESSVRCCERISRWRARLVDLRAEVVGSESRMRDSWPIRAERWMSVSVGYFVEDGLVGVAYLFEYLIQLLLSLLFLFAGFRVDVCFCGKSGICMEQRFCLERFVSPRPCCDCLQYHRPVSLLLLPAVALAPTLHQQLPCWLSSPLTRIKGK